MSFLSPGEGGILASKSSFPVLITPIPTPISFLPAPSPPILGGGFVIEEIIASPPYLPLACPAQSLLDLSLHPSYLLSPAIKFLTLHPFLPTPLTCLQRESPEASFVGALSLGVSVTLSPLAP